MAQSKRLIPVNPILLIFFILRMIVFFTVTTVLLIALFLSNVLRSGTLNFRLLRLWGGITCLIWGIRKNVFREAGFPEKTPCIIVCNHQSYFDIPFLLAVFRTPFRFAADECIFRFPFFSMALNAAGCIRVERKSPSGVRKTIRDAAASVKQGQNLLIFHEGGINRGTDQSHLWQLEFGFSAIASEADAPVFAISIFGLDRLQRNPARFFTKGGCLIPESVLPREQTSLKKEELRTLMQKTHERQFKILQKKMAL